MIWFLSKTPRRPVQPNGEKKTPKTLLTNVEVAGVEPASRPGITTHLATGFSLRRAGAALVSAAVHHRHFTLAQRCRKLLLLTFCCEGRLRSESDSGTVDLQATTHHGHFGFAVCDSVDCLRLLQP